MNLKFLAPCVVPLLAVSAAHAGSTVVAGGVGGGTIQGTTTSSSSQNTSIYGSPGAGIASIPLPLNQLSPTVQQALASGETVTSTLDVGGGNTVTITATGMTPGETVQFTLSMSPAN